MTSAAVADPRTPATRPRGGLAFVLPLLLAGGLGLAIGVSPRATLLTVSALIGVPVLSVRLDWAASALVGTAVFDDYLDRFWPDVTEVLAAILVVAWVIRRAGGPIGRGRSTPVLVAACCFAAVLLLATTVHPNGRPGLEVVARYGEFLLVLLVLVDSLAGPLRHDRLVRVYVWSCVAAAVCGMVTAALDASHRVVGPMVNPDDLAFYLLAAIPLAGLLRPRRKWVRNLGIAVLVLATLGTQSQGGLVGEVTILVLAVAIRILSLRAAAVWLVLVGTVAALVLAVVPHELGTRLTDQQRFVETKVSERFASWRVAGSMTLHHPVLGLGPGAFALYDEDYGRHRNRTPGRELDLAHSTVLQASSELGLLGAAALLGVFATPVFAARERWLRLGSPTTVGVAVALLAALVTALLETEQYLLPLWLLAALAAPVGARSQPLPVGH